MPHHPTALLGGRCGKYGAVYKGYKIWRECVGIEPTAEGPLLPPDLKSGRTPDPIHPHRLGIAISEGLPEFNYNVFWGKSKEVAPCYPQPTLSLSSGHGYPAKFPRLGCNCSWARCSKRTALKDKLHRGRRLKRTVSYLNKGRIPSTP